MRRSMLLTVMVVAVVITACGSADDAGPTIDPVPDDTAGEGDGDDDEVDDGEMDAPDDGDAAGSDPLLGGEVQRVIDDVTERAGVDADEVQVTVTELVTWSDGAIGCPEPGSMYTQALVEGYRIVVEAGGRSYTYHGQNGSEPFYCEQPQDPAEVR
jgi:hypothetical protein